MAHEIAKLLLEKAGTFLERSEAIKAALALGMPLSDIEAYLDWKDSLHRRGSGKANRDIPSVTKMPGGPTPKPDDKSR